MPPWICPLERERVEHAPDVLGRADLDDAHEPELAVDIADRAVGSEGEGDVRVALSRLGIERDFSTQADFSQI